MLYPYLDWDSPLLFKKHWPNKYISRPRCTVGAQQHLNQRPSTEGSACHGGNCGQIARRVAYAGLDPTNWAG
jgi:hypothetical protein